MADQKKVVLYNPAISSLNMGDHIIFDGAYRELEGLLNDSFIVEVSTHLPVSRYLRHTKDFDYKFVCGSNLLRGKMNRLFRQWDINIFNAKNIGPCVLVGTGWWQYGDEPNYYTKKLYKSVLSSDYYHSVRDSYTEMQLKNMGFENVINTGCPTMWSLTKEHCSEIPSVKSKDVVCTITDYNKDLSSDKKMIEILCNHYENVYLWLQGTKDYDYYKELSVENKKIKLIPPNLKSYDAILEKNVDYIGTRLHAGIRALQKKKRAIIIAIDNRAIEKQKDFNLKCISREEIEKLSDLINSSFTTEINIPIDNIKRWKSQFQK
ncbi:polysaccharide pyruvyl transferase family protein [Caldibacillus sp. 210928-DFI.2.22]|uniref:polysaccharide pyruvyl transferase family protein n=1 Tax=unclassified Caldibacillus TaxID=2641266 RepID=UPI001D087B79|nr:MULTISPECIES: polysaccharide pyruvyl transferase family protein [unclassified Caldibacillus]MCB7070217.1 polysaccharide pyruvyl transferase family protein [Caldibacillus sp. 210928-DFI.2.22]MCB7073824.1 polysaccharide pyruvyl transferase family protein [Caldibacillus sp. 210928-DFI.2.18]